MRVQQFPDEATLKIPTCKVTKHKAKSLCAPLGFVCSFAGSGKVQAHLGGDAFSCNPHLYFNVNEFQILLERKFCLGDYGGLWAQSWGKSLGGVKWGRGKGKEVALEH